MTDLKDGRMPCPLKPGVPDGPSKCSIHETAGIPAAETRKLARHRNNATAVRPFLEGSHKYEMRAVPGRGTGTARRRLYPFRVRRSTEPQTEGGAAFRSPRRLRCAFRRSAPSRG